MVRYRWDDPATGLAEVLKDLGGGGASAGLGAQLVQDMIDASIAARPAPINLQDVSTLVGNAIAAIKPHMSWQGAYANTYGQYKQNDVVSQGGRLLVCTQDYTPVAAAAPSVIGATSVVYASGSPIVVPLAAGSAVNDLVLVTASLYQDWTPPSWLTLALSTPGALPGFHASAWSHLLTAADVAAGSLNLGAPPPWAGGVTATVYRGITSVDTAHAAGSPIPGSAGVATEPAVTPGSPGFLHHIATAAPQAGGVMLGAQSALSNVQSAGQNGNGSVASGAETFDVGTSTPRTWAWTGNVGGGFFATGGVVPLLAAGIDLSKWTVLSTS